MIALVLLAAVAWFVTAPLRAPRRRAGEDPRLADLEARKEAKYREIRDAELDHAQGKLSDDGLARRRRRAARRGDRDPAASSTRRGERAGRPG